jgi:hypothetical protein
LIVDGRVDDLPAERATAFEAVCFFAGAGAGVKTQADAESCPGDVRRLITSWEVER